MRHFILTLAILATLAANAQLANPDFEQATPATAPPDKWTLHTNLLPAGWNFNPQVAGEVGLVEQTHGGKYALFFRGAPTQAHINNSPMIPVKTGQTFEFSAWARNGTLNLAFYEYADEKWLRTTPAAAIISARDDWSHGGGYYTVSDPAVTQVLPVLITDQQGVTVDDLSLRPVDRAATPGPDIVIENPTLKLTVGPGGECKSLFDKTLNAERNCHPGRLMFSAKIGNWALPATSCKQVGNNLELGFADGKARATIALDIKPTYLGFLLKSWEPQDLEQLTIMDLVVTRTGKVGGAIGVVFDEVAPLGLQSLHFSGVQHAAASGDKAAILYVNYNRLTRDRNALYKQPVARGAVLFGCPKDKLVATIQGLEKDYGLPFYKIDGVWNKQSPAMKKSYFFVTDLSVANVDKVIAYARRGHFNYVLIVERAWSVGGGSFDINEKNFPGGLPQLKATIGKIQRAGFKVGLHFLTAGMNPYNRMVTPVPDKGIYSDTSIQLADNIDEKATFIPTVGPPTGFPDDDIGYYTKGTLLWIGDEIIRYAKPKLDPPYGFEGCTRGFWKTEAVAHTTDQPVKHMNMAYGLVLMDADGDLLERVSQRVADVMNYCNCDGIYFDGSELLQGDHSFYNARLQTAYLDKIKRRDLIVQGSSYSPYTWHAVSRTASADGFRKIKLYLDKRASAFPWYFENLMPLDIGWYAINQNIRPDDIEYVCSRAVGFDSSISLETSTAALGSVPQAHEMIDTIAAWEDLRLSNRVPQALREEMRQPGHEFRLTLSRGGVRPGRPSETRGAGVSPAPAPTLGARPSLAAPYLLTPVEYSSWAMNPPLEAPPATADDETDPLRPFDDLTSTLQIKNTRGKPAQIELHLECGEGVRPGPDYAAGIPLELFESALPEGEAKPLDTNMYNPTTHGSRATSAGVTQEISLITDDVKESKSACRFSATSTLDTQMGWATFGRRFDPAISLKNYGVIALWVNGDGKGAALKVQLWDADGNPQDQYIPISFTGWRFIELPRPTDLKMDYEHIVGLNFYYNGMPPNTTSTTIIDGVKVLPKGTEMTNPTLLVNGQPLAFPITMKTGDRLVYRNAGDCWLYPTGTQIKQKVTPQGKVGAIENEATVTAQEASHQLRWRAALLWPDLATRVPPAAK